MIAPDRKAIRTTTLINQRLITFDEEDRMHLQDTHHDGLMFTLFIANHYFRKIMVHHGNSVNIIHDDFIKKMNISEAEITPRSSVLVASMVKLRTRWADIKFPIYIEGVNYFQKLCVIDNLSSYNVILGRPWIHEMKVVAYHQCI